MTETKHFVTLVKCVHDACNEMSSLLDALAASEKECNMAFAEIDALRRKVDSLERIQEDALELMNQCVQECNDYIAFADSRTSAAQQYVKVWYNRSCMYDNERRKVLTREASIFCAYDELLAEYEGLLQTFHMDLFNGGDIHDKG